MSASRSRSPQRARALTTLPSFPYGPANYVVPVYLSKKIPQFPSPIPRANLPFPQIYDARSLLHAVHTDPELVFQKIHGIIHERDELRIQVKNISENYENAKLDYASAKGKYEELGSIATAKQMLLWRFIERIQSGDMNVERDARGGSGEWVPNRAEKEDGLKFGDRGWNPYHPEKETGVQCTDRSWIPGKEENDDRSWILQRQETAGSDALSLTEGSSVSAGDSRGSGDSFGPKLDPNAMPFVPSPTTSFTEPVIRGAAKRLSSSRSAPGGFSGNRSITPTNFRGNTTTTPPSFSVNNKRTPSSSHNNNSTPISFHANSSRIPSIFHGHGNKAPSNFRGKDNNPSSTPSSAQYSSQDIRRTTNLPAIQPTSVTVHSTPNEPPIPDELLHELLCSLPAPFNKICPFSLLDAGPCHVRGCTLTYLCEAYNDLPDGCKMLNCNWVHEYRSCMEEVDLFECHWWKLGESNKKRKQHFRMRAHKKTVREEEWRARVTVAGLRSAHAMGRWGV